MKHLMKVLGVVLLLALTAGIGYAQETTGTVEGVVTDASQAVLPDVQITVTNKDTNQVTTLKTTGSGIYQIRGLLPGRYSVKFEKAGFSRFEAPDVLVLVGRTVKLDATMQVGTVEQTIQVTEGTPLVDTASTMIAHNVNSEEFDRLPKGRTFQSLAMLSPSVNTGAIESGFQVNGASGAENNFYIDGVSTTSVLDGRSRQEAVFEYLQEVQVKTGGLEAEYGGALGGVISAVTKSGGNDLHGEIHYYHSGSMFGVNPPKRLFIDPAASVPSRAAVGYVQDKESELRNHEFGGSLGGPFLRDKAWFFTSISPRWQRGQRDYVTSAGASDTVNRKWNVINWFNKVSFDPTSRIRSNFTWLYTPQTYTGVWSAYSGVTPNSTTLGLATLASNKKIGFFQPEQNYGGNIDFTLTNSTLLSVKGGRYYLNYKDTGVEANKFYQWVTSSVGLAGVPADLQQPAGFRTPSSAKTIFDITTRTFVQADFSQFFRAGGSHTVKAGVGTQKNVNRVYDSSSGPDGRILLYWNQAFQTPGTPAARRGTYGYYRVYDTGTIGSTGAHITHLYIQDSWRIHPRLTLNLGLRTERETIPSFKRDVQDFAFRFNFGDKLSPRLGASFDLFGNGKVKLQGSWARFYDWTKYELARGTFGGDTWFDYYRTLDTTDINQISLRNMPGTNLWTSAVRNWRVPGFDLLDPNVKPMSTDIMNFRIEYQLAAQTVFAAGYVRNHLNRTIEDLGALDETGSEVYRYGNPGEGAYKIAPVSGATCTIRTGSSCGFEMPKAVREYDALELSITRRFSRGWLGGASYVYSKLYGNYSGLQSTDEVRPTGYGGFGASQQLFADLARPGGNANRYFDLDEAMWDSKGNVGLEGRLPTDRPHVLKAYASKSFSFGTEVGGIFRVTSGTPVTTQVYSVNHIPLYVNGRGDLGRTPVFSKTDLMIAQEVKFGDVKRLRFEFNMDNVFNQKIAQYINDRLNLGEDYGDAYAISLASVDLSKGFDVNERLAASAEGRRSGIAATLNPRYKMKDVFSPGFAGRFLIKFIF